MSNRLVIPATALVFTLCGIIVAPYVTPFIALIPRVQNTDKASHGQPPPEGRRNVAATGDSNSGAGSARRDAGASASSTSPAAGQATGGNARRPPSVVVADTRIMNFPLVTRTFATAEAPDSVVVQARVTSQIREILVKDGAIVRKGDLLFVLDDRALRAQLARDQALLEKDKAQLVSATSELGRAQGLLGRSVTQQIYDQANAARQVAQATVDADQATVTADEIQLDYTRITAPIDGRLGAIQVSVGDQVNTGNNNSPTSEGLVTITAIDPVKVVFRVPQSDLHAYKSLFDAGTPPEVTVLRSGTDEVVNKGAMDFIDSTVDTASGTVTMHATFANAGQTLWPGESVDVTLSRGEVTGVAVIPAVAVQPGQNGSFVYRVNDDSTVEMRPVKIAASNDRDAAISEGLAAGDKVVTEGQLRLRPGDSVTVATSGNQPPLRQANAQP